MLHARALHLLRASAARQNRVESWVKDFDLSVADQRTLYLASADLLRSSRVRMPGRSHATCAVTHLWSVRCTAPALEQGVRLSGCLQSATCAGTPVFGLQALPATARFYVLDLWCCCDAVGLRLPAGECTGRSYFLSTALLKGCQAGVHGIQCCGTQAILGACLAVQRSQCSLAVQRSQCSLARAQKKAAGAKDAFKLTLKALASFEVRAHCKQSKCLRRLLLCLHHAAVQLSAALLMAQHNAG